jgi:hypothetical protein
MINNGNVMQKAIAQLCLLVCCDVAVASTFVILEKAERRNEKKAALPLPPTTQENCIKSKLHFMMYNSTAYRCMLSSC